MKELILRNQDMVTYSIQEPLIYNYSKKGNLVEMNTDLCYDSQFKIAFFKKINDNFYITNITHRKIN